MSEREPRPDPREASGEEQELAALLRRAGPRPELPEKDLGRIADAARMAWRFQVQRRRRRRVLAAIASLAALLAIATAVVLWTAESAAPLVAAEIEAISGPVLLLDADENGRPLAVGDSVGADSRLATAADQGSASLRLSPTGTILRLDHDSRLHLAAAGAIELERGALYIDSGADSGGEGVAVRTRYGTARDVGTQFSVRLLDGAASGLRVRVRRGAVAVERLDQVHLTQAGEELLVEASGSVSRRVFAPDDPDWTWAMSAAPHFEIDGRSLAEVLRWSCREAGWHLRFADPAVARDAESIVVRGGIGALRADQAPFAVLPGAGLEAELEGGVLTVRRPG